MVKVMSQADVLGIIKDLGTTMTKQTLTGKTYAPATGTVTESGASTETVYATPPMPYRRGMIEGATLERAALVSFIAAKDVSAAPIKGYEITFNSIVWKIVGVETFYDDATAIMWMVELEKP